MKSTETTQTNRKETFDIGDLVEYKAEGSRLIAIVTSRPVKGVFAGVVILKNEKVAWGLGDTFDGFYVNGFTLYNGAVTLQND